MTAPKRLVPDRHWRIRVVFPGAILHLASTVEPKATFSAGRLAGCEMEPLEDDTVADTVGFIDWATVIGLTWRAFDAADDSEERVGPVSVSSATRRPANQTRAS